MSKGTSELKWHESPWEVCSSSILLIYSSKNKTTFWGLPQWTGKRVWAWRPWTAIKVWSRSTRSWDLTRELALTRICFSKQPLPPLRPLDETRGLTFCSTKHLLVSSRSNYHPLHCEHQRLRLLPAASRCQPCIIFIIQPPRQRMWVWPLSKAKNSPDGCEGTRAWHTNSSPRSSSLTHYLLRQLVVWALVRP